MSSSQYPISIIIPVGPNETTFGSLIEDLVKLSPEQVQVIIVCCSESAALKDKVLVEERLNCFHSVWLEVKVGRAVQMNRGAEAALGDFLWFLHLDSRFSVSAFSALFQSTQNHPDDLLYFDLAWQEPSPIYYRINALGANLRSRILGIPFGDQGFCLSKKNFLHIGGFSEQAPYGEDHLFIWKLRQNGFSLKRTGETLYTSARKYQQKGWLKLTCLYQYLWIAQAIPECWRMIKNGFKKPS